MFNDGFWKGFDLSERLEKHKRAFSFAPVRNARDVPVIGYCPTYFLFGSDVSSEYYRDHVYMLRTQVEGAVKHLTLVDDDFIPYFMPWFGTGVIASAFGCEVKLPDLPGNEPAITGYAVHKASDIAKLKLPDPQNSGLMPRVLEFIDYAAASGELPVGLTDMNSPLSTAAQICGYENLFIWMYDEPDAVHELMEKVCEAFGQWVMVQKEHAGDAIRSSNGLQGVWSPDIGIWVSDDDLVSLSPDLYEEFVVPHYSRLFGRFGGASLHYCGKADHQLDPISKIDHVKAINNSPLGGFAQFERLYRKFHGNKMIQVQDIAPVDIEAYYSRLFENIDNFDGMLFINWCIESIGMDMNGGSVRIKRDVYETANRIATVIRAGIDKKLGNKGFAV